MPERTAAGPPSPAIRGDRLGRAVASRLRQSLTAGNVGSGHITLDRLRIRLPAGASEAAIADAIGRAVVGALRARRR